MTQNSALKKAIRARMAETGEKYTEARRAVLSEFEGGTMLKPRHPFEDDSDDVCRVCGSEGKLSFEHVPPKSVGNRGRVELLGIEAWLRREDHGAKVRGTISQKGAGAYSLCQACNNRAGRLYVPEFRKLHGTGRKALAELDLAALDGQTEAGYVEVEAEGVGPAPLAKQIVTMLLAISPSSFAAANPELTAYAREPDRIGLPSKYQFYLALYAGPNARFNGGSIAARLNEQGEFDSIPVWELAYPPFAYVMTIDEERPALETGVITGFTDVGIEETGNLSITLKVGFGHTVFPLDLRTKATMEADRAENEAKARTAPSDAST